MQFRSYIRLIQIEASINYNNPSGDDDVDTLEKEYLLVEKKVLKYGQKVLP